MKNCNDCGHGLEYLKTKAIYFCRLCDGCIDVDFSGNYRSIDWDKAEAEYKKKFGYPWAEKIELS